MTGDTATRQARLEQRVFELFEGLLRAGPGDPVSTRRALALVHHLPTRARVLDVGCGPGAGSAELAALTGQNVIALDRHAPFVARARQQAIDAGCRARVHPVCGDMRDLPFPPGSFDLIWAEGSLYSLGFANGVKACADLLRPGGCLACSEAVWTAADPPDAIRRWWDVEYGDIGPIDAKAEVIRAAGLTILGHFTLPRDAWAHHYYAPIRARLDERRQAWADDEAGLVVIRAFETEIAMHDRFGDTYSYEFFVARRHHSTSRNGNVRDTPSWSTAISAAARSERVPTKAP